MKRWEMFLKISGFAVAVLAAGFGVAQAEQRFELKDSQAGVAVHLDGKLFTEYVIGQGNKPYLYPVIGPSGVPMTRSYPMESVDGEQKDHPHHRSIWFGQESMNGSNTWSEALTVEEAAARKKTPEEQDKARKEGLAKLGATVHREFVTKQAGAEKAVIVTRNDYVDSSGNKLMADERTYTFRAPNAKTRVIDVELVFSAPYGPAVMGDIKDAGFSIRVPTPLAVDSKQGGVLINSHGAQGKDTWGKRADWCDYSGTLNGQKVGVAMMNHPASWQYPTPWHARTYGLLTANPFGLKAIAGEEKSGQVELQGADTLKLRYRFLFHLGDAAEAGIQQAWEAYAAER